MLFTQPFKTYYFELVIQDGKLVPHYHKKSEAVLIPGLTNGTEPNALDLLLSTR